MEYLISVLVSAHTVFGCLIIVTGAVLILASMITVVDFVQDDLSDRHVTLFKKLLLPIFGAVVLGFILTPEKAVFVKAVAP